MGDFNLSEFLSAQESEGSLQGEGSFTVSHDKARQKMTRYSLPREHSWVLKLVQAAVLWGCENLTLTQTRTTSVFHLNTSHFSGLPKMQELIQALLRADFESAEARDCLGSALRYVVERLHLSFLLSIDRKDGDPEAVYAGVHFGEMDEAKRLRFRTGWGSGITLAIHHISHTETNRLLLSFIAVRRYGLPMLSELEKFAYVAPIPIKVDGRRIDGIMRSSEMRWTYYRKPLRINSFDLPGDEAGGFCPCEGVGDRVFSAKTTPQRAARHQFTTKSAPAFFVLDIEVEPDFYTTLDLERRVKLSWVRNGVILQEKVLPIETRHLGLKIFVNAVGLKTDLTGFQLLENEEFRLRKYSVFKQIGKMLADEKTASRNILDDDLDELSFQDVEKMEKAHSDRQVKRGAKLAIASTAVAPFTGIIAAGVVLTGLGAGAYVATRKARFKAVQWEATHLKKRYPEELSDLLDFFRKKTKVWSPELGLGDSD